MPLPLHHRLTNTANVGLALATSNFRSPSLARAHAPNVDAVGFTAPTLTYERMRALQANAVGLNSSINAFLPDGPYKARWRAWLDAWTPFYEKYAGPDASTSAKLGAAFISDEISQQTDQYEAQYNALYKDYGAQKMANGSAPPAVSAPIPFMPGGSSGLGLPWWFWLGTGALLVGGGYLVYKKYQEGKAKLHWLDEKSPEIIDTFVPGGHGKDIKAFGQAGRDDGEDVDGYEVIG